jgi:hypothetical protein
MGWTAKRRRALRKRAAENRVRTPVATVLSWGVVIEGVPSVRRAPSGAPISDTPIGGWPPPGRPVPYAAA